MSADLIIGIHSINEALKNNSREVISFYCTEEARTELVDPKAATFLSKHAFQEKSKELFKKHGFEYVRVPTGAILECSSTPLGDMNKFLDLCETSEKLKILCLDGITDIHNAAAITRTAGFFKADIILLSGKNKFSFTPGFYRIASGAVEHIQFIQVTSLPKALAKIQEKGISLVGLSEHEANSEIQLKNKICLILGSEQKGISHAVLRLCDQKVSLQGAGEIKSLNVSVAAALSMDKVFKTLES